ncbi:MAG: hypothetical protein ATN34_05375 [Epulopiscium sp. Nele67-Bin002]|nr:MAG: hypothetical protein ATN34_05375 [Epulopiscium sp. Nele67-Bin002]
MYTILVVEDEKLIRKGIKSMVERSAVPIKIVLECNSGIKALEILQTEKVDIMFTDIRMPKMTGLELVDKVNETPNPPLIVAISGYDDFNYAVALLRNGVREYLLKPVDRDKIKEVLHKLTAELAKKQETKEMIETQQLRLLIHEKNLTDCEKNSIVKYYKAKYETKNYIIANGLVKAENNLISLGENTYIIYNNEDLEVLANVGVSEITSGIENIEQANRQAILARKEAFSKNKKIVRYEEIIQLQNTNNTHVKKMKKLAQQIGTPKIEQVISELKAMEDEIIKGAIEFDVFEANMRTFIQEILDTYQSVLQVEKLELTDDILEYANINMYMDSLTTNIKSINDSINNKFDDYKNKQKIQEAILFIKENYNTDLNMAVVSNHISMNYSLFSYVFKQYTNKNFVSYLKEIRIAEAKKLLETTNLKITEIGHKVGYENEKHFMKIFRSESGVSPTEYRKNMLLK